MKQSTRAKLTEWLLILFIINILFWIMGIMIRIYLIGWEYRYISFDFIGTFINILIIGLLIILYNIFLKNPSKQTDINNIDVIDEDEIKQNYEKMD